MTMFLTMAAILYPALLVIYFLVRAQAKPRGGLLFGVGLAEFQVKEPEVEAIIIRFRRQMKLALAVVAVVPLSFALVPYMSIQLTLWILWIFVMIVVLYLPYVRANQSLRRWKAAVGVSNRRERVIYAELHAGLRTLRFTSFLPAVLLSVLAVVVTGLAVRGQGLGAALFSMATFAAMTPLFGGCAVWMDRQRLKVISADSDVNLNYNRALRGQWKRTWLVCAWLNGAFTALLSLVLWLEGYELWLMTMFYGALIYTALLLLAVIWLLVENHRLNKLYRDKMDLVGYVDDDENWLWGLVYCNPGDCRVGVEKRFGVGTTMNMATPAGKVMGVFLALVLAGTLALCGWMVLEEFTPLRLEIRGESLVAEHLLEEYVIDLEDVEDAVLLENRPDWSRINGTAMPTLLKGTFRLRDTGERVEVFLNPENTYCVAITVGDTAYYFSCSTDEETLRLYELLQ